MMVEMDANELGDVYGQAYVLTVGEQQFSFKGLEERSIDARIDAFFAAHPKVIARLRDGATFALPRILGAISDRAGLDLPPVELTFSNATGVSA